VTAQRGGMRCSCKKLRLCVVMHVHQEPWRWSCIAAKVGVAAVPNVDKSLSRAWREYVAHIIDSPPSDRDSGMGVIIAE